MKHPLPIINRPITTWLYRWIGVSLIVTLCLITCLLTNRHPNNPTTTAKTTNAELAKNTTAPPAGVSAELWTQIQDSMREKMLAFNFSKEKQLYQAVNGQQNLSYSYFNSGFTVQPVTTNLPAEDPGEAMKQHRQPKKQVIANWDARFELQSVETDQEKHVFNGHDLQTDGRKARIEDEKVRIAYENNEQGMRQNFVIKKAPVNEAGNKKIIVNCVVKTNLKVVVKNNTLQLMTNDSTVQLQYKELKVWDATGTDLAAKMVATGDSTYTIEVEATGAQYPVTIDPLVSANPFWSWEPNGGSRFGYAMTPAGDINNDGFDDFVIGAWNNNGGGMGAIYAFYGKATGVGTVTSVIGESGSQLGYTVAAGDFNGDGYKDVLAGAPAWPANAYWGQARIYYGSATGMSSTVGWTLDGDHVNGTYFGDRVASAGDLNHDGYDDIIVSASQYSLPSFFSICGKVCIYYGSASGPHTTPDWQFIGTMQVEMLGSSTAAADLNGDGYIDVAVHGPGYKVGTKSFSGKVYVFYNGPSGLHTTPDWTVEGANAGDALGEQMQNAGDVNGDGYDDLIIATDEYNSKQGIAYVYYGSATGLGTSANWSHTGQAAQARYSHGIASAGDVNNDGFHDLIVTDQYDDMTGVNGSGHAWIYVGSASGLSPTANWYTTTNDWQLSFGHAGISAGDIDNDGYDEVLVSNVNNSYAGVRLYKRPVIVLPLTLLSFAYQCRGIDVQLLWRTTEEVNFKKFVIEKSTNGSDWQYAGSVDATGTPTGLSNYNYFVPIPTTTNFYRLKMVDIDGKYTYSQVLTVKNTCGEQSNFTWIAAPNPIRSSGTLQLNLNNYINSNEPLKVQLTDMMGLPRILTTLTVPAQATLYSTSVKLPAVAPGTYTLTIRNRDITNSKRVTIIN